MKIILSVFCVVLLASAVISGCIQNLPANHHKKIKGNVKVEKSPSAGNGDNPVKSGDVHWPKVEVSRIHNFPVPEAFKHGPTNNNHTEPSTGKHHGRSNHRSHSQ